MLNRLRSCTLFGALLTATIVATPAHAQAPAEVDNGVDPARLYEWFDPIVDVQYLIANRFVTAPDLENMQTAAIRGMLEALGDRYTEFIPTSALEQFNKDIRGEYVGIGASVTMADGFVTIVSPLDDSPAYEAGVLAGDRIVAVDGESTEGKSIDEVIDLLTGVPGTTVLVTVERMNERIDIEIVRAQITTRAVTGWRRGADDRWEFMLDAEHRIGYLRVTQFTASAVPEFQEAMRELIDAGARGVIIDLRNNPGGLLSAAIQMADFFLDDGLIVSTRGRAHEEQSVYAGPDDTIFDGPVVVMVNRRSASASEIVAGALRDNGRALVVGERSFGKGSVQNLIPLPSGAGQLKITEQRYYGPSDVPIHREDDSERWGVDPSPGFFTPVTDEEAIEMARLRREAEIIDPDDEDEQITPGEMVGEAQWILDNLRDRPLAVAVEAMHGKIIQGEWSRQEQSEEAVSIELAELRRAQEIRERIMRELRRVDQRIGALSAGVDPDSQERPRLLPEGVSLEGGRMLIYDAQGEVVATLNITDDAIERWIFDAPLEPAASSPN